MPTSTRNQFLLFFILCSLQYCFIQFVLPYILPGLFDYGGLLKMSKDSKVFHELALLKANQIHELGWSAWELRPDKRATSGVASILYYFVPSLAMTIPLCAALQSFSAISLGKIIRDLNFSVRAAAWVSFLFVLHPISLQWNSQHHKDSYAVLGMFLIILGFIRLHKSRSMKEGLINFTKYSLPGIALIWLVRPYLLEILIVVFLASITFTFVLHRKKSIGAVWSVLLITIGLSSIYSASDIHLVIKATREPIPMLWDRTPFLPDFVDERLKAFARNRRTFIMERGKENTTLNSGGEIKNSFEVLMFLPRAFLDSLIQPIPFSFTHRNQETGSFVMGIIGGFDMLISYILLMFCLYFLCISRNQVIAVNVSCILFMLLTVMAFSFPNMGTMYRMRYPFYTILLAIGFSQAFDSMPRYKAWYRSKFN